MASILRTIGRLSFSATREPCIGLVMIGMQAVESNFLFFWQPRNRTSRCYLPLRALFSNRAVLEKNSQKKGKKKEAGNCHHHSDRYAVRRGAWDVYFADQARSCCSISVRCLALLIALLLLFLFFPASFPFLYPLGLDLVVYITVSNELMLCRVPARELEVHSISIAQPPLDGLCPAPTPLPTPHCTFI